jgi:hypothetical protein
MIKKKTIPKLNFVNPKKIGIQSIWEGVIAALGIAALRNVTPRTQPLSEYHDIITPQPFLNNVVYNNETTQLYTVLENEDGWYTDGTYESIFITIDMKKFIW